MIIFRVKQVNKKTGVTYVYEAESYWDKDKKQPRNKQVCIGKIDPKTGEFIPSKRLDPKQAAVRDPSVTATAKIIGPSMILDSVSDEIGLDRVLKGCFPESYRQILSIAYYLSIRGDPLSHCESWSKRHVHPAGDVLTSQRISEIIRNLDDDKRSTFFNRWVRKVMENDYLCYDITSVSSYGELNEYLKYGYNRDGEKLKQINLAFLLGQKSQIPVYYQRLPGNISDVTTLHNLLKTLNYLNLGKIHLIMDKGFYSQNNVDELLSSKDKFILAVPNRIKWVQELIDKARDDMQTPKNYRKSSGEVIYATSKVYPWGKDRRRCYAHLYFNSYIAAANADGFMEELLTYKEELESGNLIKEHEEEYEKFFTVKETPARGRKVIFKDGIINRYRNNYAGFYAILTNDIKDPMDALWIYRNKDLVEKCFNDLKNQLDMKRLRIHSSQSMDGRLFLQFIAVILMSALRKKLKDTGLNEKYSVRELLLEMETLTRIYYSGRYGHILTEITKPQRLILDALDLHVDS